MNLVEWAFGKRMTPAERLRKHQRALEKTQRELDRERVKLENQEKKLVADIKKECKEWTNGPSPHTSEGSCTDKTVCWATLWKPDRHG